MRKFHHFGLPTAEQHPGESFAEATRCWRTDPNVHAQRIEYLRFEPDSQVTGAVRTMPHVAFEVDDLETEIAGKKVLLGPFVPAKGRRVVFVEQDGAVWEFIQYDAQRG